MERRKIRIERKMEQEGKEMKTHIMKENGIFAT